MQGCSLWSEVSFTPKESACFPGLLIQPLFFCLKEVVLIFFFLDTLIVVAAPENTAGGVGRGGLVTLSFFRLPGGLTAIQKEELLKPEVSAVVIKLKDLV